MPAPIPDDVRAAILDHIRQGGTCRGIARDHGVSTATVRNIARDNDITDAFSRARTKNATEARTADLAAQRADLKAVLLDDARRLRERAWSEYTYYERSATGPERVTLDLPPLAEVRQAYTALGIALDKHTALDRHDADHGVSGAKSMLDALADQLGVQPVRERPADE